MALILTHCSFNTTLALDICDISIMPLQDLCNATYLYLCFSYVYISKYFFAEIVVQKYFTSENAVVLLPGQVKTHRQTDR